MTGVLRLGLIVLTWWLAMRTMRRGKLHSRLPSGLWINWPGKLASPLTWTLVGDHHWVKVVTSTAKDCLVNAM